MEDVIEIFEPIVLSIGKNIQNIIDHIARFPTIGPKTAERIVLYLLTMPADELEDFSQAISKLHHLTRLKT